jgi:hypothetical protein
MRQLFIDARDKTSGTNANFTITLPQTLALGSGHQGRIDDLRLPVTTPTIYEGNNTIDFWVDGEYKTATIATGNYGSGSDLATAIRNALAFAKAGSWDVTYTSVISMKIYYENPWTLTGGSYGQRLLDRPHKRDSNTKGYEFLYAPLQGLDMVYLCSSNFITLDNVGPKGASDCLCAIPINVGFGSVQTYSMSNSVYFEIPATTTQSLSFQLRDRDNNLVHALQNVAFTLTID